MRLANIVTAISDILAGLAIAGALLNTLSGVPMGTGSLFTGMAVVPVAAILLLVLSTACLYGGGVVLNDVFDAELDQVERPERPIPSGLVSKRSAAVFGTALLCIGIAAAFFASRSNSEAYSLSPWLAAAIAVASVVYDRWGKHSPFFGPLNMGLCRALNLLLGMSLLTYAVQIFWPLAVVPMIYIAAITMISRGEVHGGKKTTLYLAAVFYILVLLSILFLAFEFKTLMYAVPFVFIFSILIFPSLQQAVSNPTGPRIGKAVKSGVIALIAMNASWAAAFGDIYFALLILLLLPLSLLLARLFAVT